MRAKPSNVGLLALASVLAAAACRTPAVPEPAIKYFYADLDGTLLDESQAVGEANLRAVERYRARGGKIGIATGRTPDRALAIARSIRADLPLVFANGAIITEPDGRLIRLSGITSQEDVRVICSRLATAGCKLLYVAHADPETGETQVEMNACRPPEDVSRPVVKIRARVCEQHDRILEELPALTRGNYAIVESGEGPWLGVSIAAPGVSKGTALEFIRERLGLDPKRLGFVGDSGNDLSAVEVLRRWGGRCFVMRNGVESLKAACPNHTTRDCEHGGVGEVLDSLTPDAR